MIRSIKSVVTAFIVALIACVCGHYALAQRPSGAGPPVSSANAGTEAVGPQYLGITIVALDNQTGEPNADHFSGSMTALLAGQLNTVGALLVQDTPSRYNIITHKIGAARKDEAALAWLRRFGEFVSTRRVVYGTYRREGEIWRLTAYVLNVGTGGKSVELLAASPDLFVALHELALKVASALGANPTEPERRAMERRPTSSPAAWELYSRERADHSDDGESKDKAQALLRRAIELDPAFSRAHLALGEALAEAGKYEEAAREAREAMKAESTAAFGHRLLGMIAQRGGNTDETENELREAQRLDPKQDQCVLALTATLLRQKKDQEALALLSRATGQFPANAQIHGALGLIYAQRADYKLARQELAEALRIDADDLNVQVCVFQIYSMLGETALAIQHGDKMMKRAREEGGEPDRLADFEHLLQKLKSLQKPAFIHASLPKTYSEAGLRTALRSRLTTEEMRGVGSPFSATAAMRAWAVTLTKGANTPMDRAKAIFAAVSSRADGEYGEIGNGSAADVFAAWGDAKRLFKCQELTRLYVALARAAGLQSYYVAVDRNVRGELTVAHACAAVFCDGKILLVDPEYGWFGLSHREFNILDDVQATALQMTMRGRQSHDLRLLRTALTLYPSFAFGQVQVASILAEQSRDGEARAALDAAAKLKPDYWLVFFVRGAMLLNQGAADGAIAQFRRSLALKPDQPQASYDLGIAFLQLKMLKDAHDAFSACLQNHPDSKTAEDARRKIAALAERQP